MELGGPTAEAKALPLKGWARVADYLFGRNTLIGTASLMLLVISGYATWHGMRDFIIGVSGLDNAGFSRWAFHFE